MKLGAWARTMDAKPAPKWTGLTRIAAGSFRRPGSWIPRRRSGSRALHLALATAARHSLRRMQLRAAAHRFAPGAVAAPSPP